MSDAFSFAGFNWPKPVAVLPKGRPAARLAKRRASPSCCGPYMAAPTPNANSAFYYLDSDFAPGLRWQWADEVEGASIRHTGWWTDPKGDGDKIRGVVLRLPKGRGFLAGWSMGEGMASHLESGAYAEEREAAWRADDCAESAAESEREYQAAWQAGREWSELQDEITTGRRAVLAILADRRRVMVTTADGQPPAALCDAIRARVSSILNEIQEARAKCAKLAAGDVEPFSFYPGEARLAAGFNEGAGVAVI